MAKCLTIAHAIGSQSLPDADSVSIKWRALLAIDKPAMSMHTTFHTHACYTTLTSATAR